MFVFPSLYDAECFLMELGFEFRAIEACRIVWELKSQAKLAEIRIIAANRDEFNATLNWVSK